MADSKKETQHPPIGSGDDEAPPAYDDTNPEVLASSSHGHGLVLPAQSGPTVDSPFDFPTDASVPPYSAAGSSSSAVRKPIAIPQSKPHPAAPFVPAYAPVLLSYGIAGDSWCSFVNTLSAFLAAKVSDRAVAHAADMAKELGRGPKSFGKGTADHLKSVGHDIKQRAKEGNVLGAATSVVGAAISLPIGTAFRAVGAIVSLPGSAIAAATKRPQSPRERAAAYVAAANKDWFGARGLIARLLDTTELAALVGVTVDSLLGQADGAKDASGKLQAMAAHIAQLDAPASTSLELAAATLWLVVTEASSNPGRA
ncbi:hypothetical protein GQ53DRAFT_754522 [Thozetella sp. PMI_491]|nr:hypothetical protein GQ53DRAFT_754522 [Thozetella sp. PMI_491]